MRAARPQLPGFAPPGAFVTIQQMSRMPLPTPAPASPAAWINHPKCNPGREHQTLQDFAACDKTTPTVVPPRQNRCRQADYYTRQRTRVRPRRDHYNEKSSRRVDMTCYRWTHRLRCGLIIRLCWLTDNTAAMRLRGG